MMMMIPEPWSNHETMDDQKHAFYEYHSCLMEPWDGPASIAFTDGTQIGAVLDRNGLRPSRYYVTKDDLVIMASEAGVLDVPAENVVRKGRLQPGRMFLVDTEQGRIIDDEEIKQHDRRRASVPRMARRIPDPRSTTCRQPPELPQPDHGHAAAAPARVRLHVRGPAHAARADGARRRRSRSARWATTRRSPCCRTSRSLLYNYFKQLFAQVTNPPIDCIREELVTSAETRLGSEGNLLNPQPADCRRLELEVADPHERGVRASSAAWTCRACESACCRSCSACQPRREGPRQVDGRAAPDGAAADRGGRGQRAHPERSRRQQGVRADPGAAGRRGPAPLPDPRRHCARASSLVLETGEAREVHHFSLLIGYGVSAINPYLAFETHRPA